MPRGSNGIDGPYRVYENGTENKVKATIAGIDDQSERKVDGRPYVVAVTIASSPSRNGVYRSGEDIELSLEFDQKVEVEGTPSVELLVGEEGGRREKPGTLVVQAPRSSHSRTRCRTTTLTPTVSPSQHERAAHSAPQGPSRRPKLKSRPTTLSPALRTRLTTRSQAKSASNPLL